MERVINLSVAKAPQARSCAFLIKNILNLSSSANSKQAIKVSISRRNERLQQCAAQQQLQREALFKWRACDDNSERHFEVVDLSCGKQVAACGQVKGASRNRRTMFSQWQLASLEWRFARNKYLTTSDRKRIAKVLELNQVQVKTWFQVSSLFDCLIA